MLYVDPHDPQAIAEKVLQIGEDSELRDRLIAHGLARARQFTWRRMAERTCGVYEEVLAL